MADSACLTGNAAACNAADNIILIGSAGENERLTNDELKSFKTEILVDVTVIDGDFAGAVLDTNASHRALSAAGAVEIRFAVVHYSLPPLKR